MSANSLQSTTWLAKRLGLSVSTIERLRTSGKGDLPPHLVIGQRTIRYDVEGVERWLAGRQAPAAVIAPKTTTSLSQNQRKNVFRKKVAMPSAS